MNLLYKVSSLNNFFNQQKRDKIMNIKESFYYRPLKVNGVVQKCIQGDKEYDKRPEFSAELPYIDSNELIEVLTGESTNPDEKAKILKYLADSHNNNVYAEAQRQLNEFIKQDYNVILNPNMLDYSQLQLLAIASKEPVDRKQFSDELIAEVIEDFKHFAFANFKRPNGQAIPAQNIANAANEIFTNRFKNTKTDKDVLTLFQSWLATWYQGTSKQDQFQGITSFLLEKIELYLNTEQTSKIGKFG